MSALVKKEIRLLLPSWLAVLSLAIFLPWFLMGFDAPVEMILVSAFFGVIILSVDSFGREFSLGTFSSLLAQPVERRRIWRVKITVFLFAAMLAMVGFFISYAIAFFTPSIISTWHQYPALILRNVMMEMVIGGVVMLAALVGGLWTTLLIRQIAASFWIAFLAPGALMMLVYLFMPSKLAENKHVVLSFFCGVAIIYIIAGFWLAHRLFHRAQDVAWTGGVISFSTWRYFETGSKSSISTRHRKPFRALLKKEFQLQGITFFCAAALLVLHIGIFFMRIFYANYHKGSVADVISDCFWMLWLVMPLIIGGTAVAEEQKLGVTGQQFCLPASRRTLFTIKFIPTMIFGVLLGGIMPLLMETLAAHLGSPSETFKLDGYSNLGFENRVLLRIFIVTVSAGLTLAALFASTLARNFLQALSITIVTIVGCVLFGSFIAYISHQRGSIFGILPWPSLLPVIIGIPTMVFAVLWLVYRNFSYFHEGGRLWWRNIIGVIGALVFVFVSSALIYNRAWEVFEPAEPSHGLAKLSLTNPPNLQMVGFRNLLLRLPDGRVWVDRLADYYEGSEFYTSSRRWKYLWQTLVQPLPESIGPQQFLAGSNWVAATTGYSPSSGFTETVGIQPDGTLWISGKSHQGNLAAEALQRYGNETNWLHIAQFRSSVVLLKTDGTLWRWGSDTNRLDPWPGLRTFTPHQIGTNSDWQELVTLGWIFTKQTDGRVWRLTVDWKTGKPEFIRATNYDEVILQTSSGVGDQRTAFVRADGTLWVVNRYWDEKNRRELGNGVLQVGKENDWRAVAMSYGMMVGLKADGSLWQWNSKSGGIVRAINDPPIRLGSHDDWVAIVSAWDNVISLAADGSLWLWPDKQSYNNNQETLLKLPKQPKFLGNVFGKPD